MFFKNILKIIFERINCFINKHDVLNPRQYGFKKGISTAYVIINTVTSTQCFFCNGTQGNGVPAPFFAGFSKF